MFLTDTSAMEKKTGEGGCASSHEPLLCMEIHGYDDDEPYCVHLAAALLLCSACNLADVTGGEWIAVADYHVLCQPSKSPSGGKWCVSNCSVFGVGKSHGRLQGVHICSLLAQDFRAVTRKLDRQGPWCGSPIPMLAAIPSPTYPGITVGLKVSHA